MQWFLSFKCSPISLPLWMCSHMLSCFMHVWLFAAQWIIAHRLFCPRDSPGKNTGAGCHALLQGFFLTQGSKPHFLCLLHWQSGSLPLTSPGKPHTMTTSRQIQKRRTILCLHRYPLSIKMQMSIYLLVYLCIHLYIYSILCGKYNADHKVITATI